MLWANVEDETERKGCHRTMKQNSTIIAAIASLVFAVTASAQTPAPRIAVVDLNKVFNEYYKTPIAQTKLKETADSFNKEQEDLLANYRKQIEELNKLREEQDRPEYTPEVREQKRKAVAERLSETQKGQRDIEDYRRSHAKIMEEQTQRMRENILKEINDVLEKEARTAGYTLVLDKSGKTLNGVSTVIFAQEALDISDDIIKVLNKNQPAPAAAPPKAEEKKQPESN